MARGSAVGFHFFLLLILTIALLHRVNLVFALAFPSSTYSRSLAFADLQTPDTHYMLKALKLFVL